MDEPVTTNEVLPSFFIDRDLVDEYCGSKGLDVYSLLQECVDFGISGFLDFLSKKGIHISIRGNNAKAILHGSGKVISEFEPRVSKGGPNSNQHEPLVYATDDPDYAIFLGIIKLKDEGMAYVGYPGGKVECYTNREFVNGASSLGSGYVYILNNKDFHEDALHNFSNPSSQVPLFAIPVGPADIHTSIFVKNN